MTTYLELPDYNWPAGVEPLEIAWIGCAGLERRLARFFLELLTPALVDEERPDLAALAAQSLRAISRGKNVTAPAWLVAAMQDMAHDLEVSIFARAATPRARRRRDRYESPPSIARYRQDLGRQSASYRGSDPSAARRGPRPQIPSPRVAADQAAHRRADVAAVAARNSVARKPLEKAIGNIPDGPGPGWWHGGE